MRNSARLALIVAAALALSAGSAQAVSLSNGTLFRADETGTNQNTTNGGATVARGGWGTVLNQQNVAGNYGAQLFLTTSSSPGGGDFFTPASSFAFNLQEGANKIYFWADGDDTVGGDDGFGLNLWFGGAAVSGLAISAFAPTPGTTFEANGGPGCTAGYDFSCIVGSGALSFVSGLSTVSLTDFRILGLGSGGGSAEDRVNHDNTQPFVGPPHANGVTDTYGYFTLTLTTQDVTGGIPEPSAWALMILGFGATGTALRARRQRFA